MKEHVLRSMLVVAVVCVVSWTFFAGTSGASGPLVEKHTSGPATVDRGCEDANFTQPGNVDECNGGLDVAEQNAENYTSPMSYGQSLVSGYSQSRLGCIALFQSCLATGTSYNFCKGTYNICTGGCMMDYIIAGKKRGAAAQHYFCYGSD